jgi:hypothetical protein
VKRTLFYFVICLIGLSAVGQDSTWVLLVHSRYDPGDTTNEYLVGYHFKKGVFIKQDTILHRYRIPGSEEDGRISVGLGGERIFNNRYMYSRVGILVDLWEKKLIWEKPNLTFVEGKGNKLYFNRSFFNTTLELYEYDLDKQSYLNILNRPFEGYCFRPDLCAPDYKHFLETTYDSPGKVAIYLVDSTGAKKKLVVTSRSQWSFSGSRASGKMPIAWMDEHHFVFPSYIVHQGKDKVRPPETEPDRGIETIFVTVRPDSLPCCSVELQEVDIRNGDTRFITTINGLYQQMTDDKLFKTEQGDIVFRNRGAGTIQQFLIKRESGETNLFDAGSPPFRITGNNYIHGDDTGIPDEIFFKGNKIGSFHVYIKYYDDNVIAITGSREKNGPERIFVWDTQYQDWQELPIERFLGFLGWITKKEGQ